MNDIYLNTWVRDEHELSEEQISALEDIAYMNPVEGGSCVYGAIVMLDLDPEDNDEMQGRNADDFEEKKIEQTLEFNLFPNPAQSNLEINVNMSGLFEIRDIIGNVVKSMKCLPGSTNMQIEKLHSGIYIYSFASKDKKEIKGKLSIAK